MSFIEIQNVRIAGISAAVPAKVVSNSSFFLNTNDQHYDEFSFYQHTGIKERRLSTILTAADLGLSAVERLLEYLNWERDSVEALIFVSQSADYILPSTACILQDKLGLSTDCMALDISLGCSGWVYGMCCLASLISSGNGRSIRRAILVAGDAKQQFYSNNPLFGDACTATALEYQEFSNSMKFCFGTDGSGYDTIIIPDGGARNMVNNSSFDEYNFNGHHINRLQIRLNGIDVFSFAISSVPNNILNLIKYFQLSVEDFEYIVLHQANKEINNRIIRKLQLDPLLFPSSLELFANTSSASIPLTIVTQLRNKLENQRASVICCGFGVGFSWGSLACMLDRIAIPQLVNVTDCFFYNI